MATQMNTQTKMFKTGNDLPEETRSQMVDVLNQQLADTTDLFTQTKQAHWNVKGPEFFQLHKLYDELAAEVLEFVDLIAERATALGGLATGTARMAAASTRLPEMQLECFKDLDTVNALIERYAQVANSTREAIDTADEAGDQGTADLFTEVVRGLDKALYFLEAHLQRG